MDISKLIKNEIINPDYQRNEYELEYCVSNSDLKHYNKTCKDYIYKKVFFMYIKIHIICTYFIFKIMQL